MSNDSIRPFTINIPEDDLVDLRRRLKATRWPEKEAVEDWTQGTPLSYVQDICEYWANSYDWRATEKRLNEFPQFVTEIDGLDIHFIHVRSPHPEARAAHRHARLAGLDRRIPQGHRAAYRPDEVRRQGQRRVPRGRAVAARLRLLGQAGEERLERRAHRRCLGRADGPPRLRRATSPRAATGAPRSPAPSARATSTTAPAST